MKLSRNKDLLGGKGPAVYQLVGRVMAYQGDDEYPAREGERAHWDWDTAQTPTGGSSEEYCAMDESLTQRRRVKDEAPRGVNFDS